MIPAQELFAVLEEWIAKTKEERNEAQNELQSALNSVKGDASFRDYMIKSKSVGILLERELTFNQIQLWILKYMQESL